jgi:hypothetical protein
MKTKKMNVGLELAKEALAIDPTSDRYRICPYCKTPHMVKNKGRDYCDDKCADAHYNYLRKYRNLGEIDKEKKLGTDKKMQELENQLIPGNSPDPKKWEEAFEKNIKILNELLIDAVKGSKFKLDYLKNLGFEFWAHTTRAPLYNTEKETDAHLLIYADYQIYQLDYNVILIYHKNLNL